MEATIQYIDNVKFEVVSRGHRVICDQPVQASGTDAGMTPPEFLLASLGTCAMFYAVQYLRARNLPAEGTTVRIAAEKALNPARLESFRIEVDIPSLPEDKHKDGVLRAVKSCLIHNTLQMPPRIEFVVNTAATANNGD